jgi:hypothetical protein
LKTFWFDSGILIKLKGRHTFIKLIQIVPNCTNSIYVLFCDSAGDGIGIHAGGDAGRNAGRDAGGDV